jgi:hypothetical protein
VPVPYIYSERDCNPLQCFYEAVYKSDKHKNRLFNVSRIFSEDIPPMAVPLLVNVSGLRLGIFFVEPELKITYYIYRCIVNALSLTPYRKRGHATSTQRFSTSPRRRSFLL